MMGRERKRGKRNTETGEEDGKQPEVGEKMWRTYFDVNEVNNSISFCQKSQHP
jgi:hypothetical protein